MNILEILQIYLADPWVVAIVILALFIFAGQLINALITWYLNNIARRTKTKFDDFVLAGVRRPIMFLVVLLGLRYGFISLGFHGGQTAIILNSLLIVTVFYGLVAIYDITLGVLLMGYVKRSKSKVDDTLVPIMRKFGKVILWVIAGFFILNQWGINITPFLGGLGVAGIVAGLAIKDALSNVFGGVALILDSAVNVNDKIKLDSGETGIIQEIGLRSTKVRTFNNEVIIIPNGIMANTKIQNYVQPDPSARFSVEFAVEYGTEIAKVRKTVLTLFKTDKQIMKKPAPTVEFIKMGESALQMAAYAWVPDYLISYNKKIEYTEKIYRALNKAKIVMPFPTRTVYLKNHSKPEKK